jgi:hypothetical protein
MAELALHGRFYQVPAWLYFRRHHEASLEGTARTIRQKSTARDPRRANHSTARLLGEYMLGYVRAIAQAPLPVSEKAACYRHLMAWMGDRAMRRTAASRIGRPWPSMVPAPTTAESTTNITRVGAIADIVAGRGATAS